MKFPLILRTPLNTVCPCSLLVFASQVYHTVLVRNGGGVVLHPLPSLHPRKQLNKFVVFPTIRFTNDVA